MINYIVNHEDFRIQENRLSEILRFDLDLPRKIFMDEFKFYLAFEFDFLYRDFFFDGLKSFMKYQRLQYVTYFTLNPSGNFFYKHFKVYNVGLIKTENSYSDFDEFLMRDPGGNQAEALAIYSTRVSIFSESDDWAIYFHRDWEIGIVGFVNNDIKNTFLNSFGENKDIFYGMSDFVKIYDYCCEGKECEELIRNYPDM